MKGAGVQYLIVIEMVVRMEKECKNTNEEENMKKNVKKVISFILSMLVIISTAVTPAMAAGTKEAPTEVKSVSFCRGLMCYTIYWLPTLSGRKNFIS